MNSEVIKREFRFYDLLHSYSCSELAIDLTLGKFLHILISMREKVVYVKLNEREAQMCKELEERYGFENTVELLRYLIKEAYREVEKLDKGRAGGEKG